MTFLKKVFFTYSIVFALVIVFIAGWGLGNNNPGSPLIFNNAASEETGELIGKNSNPPAWLSNDVEFDLFWEAWRKIQDDFVDTPIVEPTLFYGAMRGMVSSLGDPYSVFMEPEDATEFNEELAGRFEGIGAEIGIKNQRLTIIAPLPESPAEASGLKAGDKVFSIDDFDTTDISLNEAVNRIRGEGGTDVTLTVHRGEELDFRDITITRDTIRVVSVRYEMKQTASNKKIGYIKISNFHEDTSGRFREAVNELLAQGPDGFILDMRNNPGGFLDKAIDVSSYWVAAGEIVVMEKFSDENIKNHYARGSNELNEFPTIVLVNGGSASGSEIVAGALQDFDLATLVGETTFGKGSVQDLTNFRDGSAMKLTIARWLTPNGRTIDAEGIVPDEEIELSEEDYNNDVDPQLDKALELLN